MSNLFRVSVERFTNKEKRRNQIKEMIEKLAKRLEYYLQIKNETEQQMRYRIQIENNLVKYKNTLIDLEINRPSTSLVSEH